MCLLALHRKKTPTEDLLCQLIVLLLELLKSHNLPELAVGGAWVCLDHIMNRCSAALGLVALEAGICEVAVDTLRTVGSSADWIVSLLLPVRPHSANLRGCGWDKLDGMRAIKGRRDTVFLAEHFTREGWPSEQRGYLHAQYGQGFQRPGGAT